jgi:alcohol dehydrogenase, propanol-preferring
MRAAVLDDGGQPLRLTELPVPTVGPGELLVRLEASGVCHTDVHIWKGEMVPPSPPEPFVLGHEGVGRVAAIGQDVFGWKIGDRAGAAWLHDTCGTCAACTSGRESFCQAQQAHGFNVPGTFAEYVIVKARYAVPLPEGPATDLAPLMCAGVTAYGALDRANLQHGETCAIIGCGGLGLYAVQLAERRGAKVLAVDSDPAKLALAQNLGASDVALTSDLPTHSAADVTVNFAPTPKTWAAMVALTRPLGRIVAAAMVAEPVSLSQEWLASTGITLTGTSVGTRAQMLRLMDLHRKDPLHAFVEDIELTDINRALLGLATGRARGRYCIVY